MSNQSLRSVSKSILNSYKAGRLSFEQAAEQLIAKGCKSWMPKLEALEAEELASFSMDDLFYGKDEETVDAIEATNAMVDSFEAVETVEAESQVTVVEEAQCQGRTLSEVIKAHQPKKVGFFSKAIKSVASVAVVVSVIAVGIGLGVSFNASQNKAPIPAQSFTTL